MTRSPYAQKWRALKKRRPKARSVQSDDLSTVDYLFALLPANRPSRAPGGLNFAGVSLQKGGLLPMDLFKSRKFWASVAGLLLVVIQQIMPDFPLDAEQVTNVIYVLVAYVIGTGLEDSAAPKG